MTGFNQIFPEITFSKTCFRKLTGFVSIFSKMTSELVFLQITSFKTNFSETTSFKKLVLKLPLVLKHFLPN